MKRTVAAAVFALLALTAPARAATIQWNLEDVTGAGGVTVTGFFDWNTAWVSSDNALVEIPFSFTITNLSTLPPITITNATAIDDAALVDDLGPPISLNGAYAESAPTATRPPVNILVAVSNTPLDGSVSPINLSVDSSILFRGVTTSLSGELTTSAVPLPPAFYLFGTALAGLGGFGWLKRRGKVSA